MESEADPQPGQPTEQTPETPDSLKEKGNQCVKNNNYLEAILHYTYAIKLSPNDPILYSNRSFAFLKATQYYYANEDAEKAIQLKPDWAKAYFRRAEVLAAAGQYDSALLSYGRALQLQPSDISILNAAKRIAVLSNQEKIFDKRLPWVGAGVGIIIGVIIVIADQLVTKSPTLTHPSIMVLLVIAISIVSYGIARLYHHYDKMQKRGLLEPPLDLLEGFQKEPVDQPVDEELEATPNRQRYTKAQARQRFRKGKS